MSYVPHSPLGWGNPSYTYKSMDKRLQSNLTQRDLGVWVDDKLNRSQQCARSAKWANHVPMHQAQHCEPVKKGDCPTLHHTGAAPPQVLWAVLTASLQEGHQTMKVYPEEGNQNGEWFQGQEEWLRSPGLFSLEKSDGGTSLQSTTSSREQQSWRCWSLCWPVIGLLWNCVMRSSE